MWSLEVKEAVERLQEYSTSEGYSEAMTDEQYKGIKTMIWAVGSIISFQLMLIILAL